MEDEDTGFFHICGFGKGQGEAQRQKTSENRESHGEQEASQTRKSFHPVPAVYYH